MRSETSTLKIKSNSKGFTLVELIVVVSILAVISTIGFIAYSGYLSGIRDTSRIHQLSELNKALVTFGIQKRIPLPDINTEITFSGTLMGYQGILGEKILDVLNYKKGGLDPLDNTYYIYYVTRDRKYFQLMAFLENNNYNLFSLNNSYANVFYSKRYPHVSGNKLGIFIGAGFGNNKNKPLNIIYGTGTVEINTLTNQYSAILSNKDRLTGSGNILKQLNSVLLKGGRGYYISSTGALLYIDLDNL